MSRLALFLGSVALVLAAGAAQAQDRPRPQDLARIEEQMLREQLERFLNDSAHWDAERGRIVFDRDDAKDLGGLQVPLAAVLGRVARPGDDGRLHVRDEVKLRPFVKVVEDFMAQGGMDDIEKLQRLRREGVRENPFADGIPPRVTKLAAGLMKALEDQARGGGDEDQDEPKPEKNEKKRAAREEAKERKIQVPPEIADRLKKGLGDRLKLDPQELEARLRVLRDLADQAQREMARVRDDLEREIDDFAKSEKGQRLRRRAESEIRRITESEEFQKGLADAQKRAMDFLSSERGQELQRRAFEFFESEDGRALRKRIDDFLSSDQGRAIAERLGNLMKDFGKRPPERGGGETGPRRERRPEAPKPEGGKEREGKRARLY